MATRDRDFLREALGESFRPMSANEMTKILIKQGDNHPNYWLHDDSYTLSDVTLRVIYQDNAWSERWIGNDSTTVYILSVCEHYTDIRDFGYRDDIMISATCLPSSSIHIDQAISLFEFNLREFPEDLLLRQARSSAPQAHKSLFFEQDRIRTTNRAAAEDAIALYRRHKITGVIKPAINLSSEILSILNRPTAEKVKILSQANNSTQQDCRNFSTTWSAPAFSGRFIVDEACRYFLDDRDICLEWAEIPEPACRIAERLFFSPMTQDEIEDARRWKKLDLGTAAPGELYATIRRLREAAEAELDRSDHKLTWAA